MHVFFESNEVWSWWESTQLLSLTVYFPYFTQCFSFFLSPPPLPHIPSDSHPILTQSTTFIAFPPSSSPKFLSSLRPSLTSLLFSPLFSPISHPISFHPMSVLPLRQHEHVLPALFPRLLRHGWRQELCSLHGTYVCTCRQMFIVQYEVVLCVWLLLIQLLFITLILSLMPLTIILLWIIIITFQIASFLLLHFCYVIILLASLFSLYFPVHSFLLLYSYFYDIHSKNITQIPTVHAQLIYLLIWYIWFST